MTSDPLWEIELKAEIPCSICQQPVRKEQKVKFELVPLRKGQTAGVAGCRYELAYRGERFGVKQAMHEGCIQ